MKYKINSSQQARMFNVMYDYIDDMMPKNFRVDFSEDGYRSKGITTKTDSISL